MRLWLVRHYSVAEFADSEDKLILGYAIVCAPDETTAKDVALSDAPSLYHFNADTDRLEAEDFSFPSGEYEVLKAWESE